MGHDQIKELWDQAKKTKKGKLKIKTTLPRLRFFGSDLASMTARAEFEGVYPNRIKGLVHLLWKRQGDKFVVQRAQISPVFSGHSRNWK